MTESTPRIQSIICKHVHDVRNSINILDLKAVLLGELATDIEVVEFLGRMRAELTNFEATVKALQIKFAEPRPFNIPARDLAQMWQVQITPLVNAARPITWAAPLGPQRLVELNGGRMEITTDSMTNERVIRLTFAVAHESVILDRWNPQAPGHGPASAGALGGLARVSARWRN